MALLERWRPSRELDRFRGELDDLFERFGFDRNWLARFPFDREFFEEREQPMRPAVETLIEGGKFVVRTDLPGIDPKDLDIKVVDNVLTIKGSRQEKRETQKADFFRREIRYGAFERALTLPEGIKAEDLKATYHDGVLELTAAMPKEAAPKEVKIQIEGSKSSGEKKPAAA
jgi:HSP20 family molecular chaperone IbpA